MQAHQYFGPNIKLEEETVDSLLSGQKSIRFKSIRNIEIVKKRLGIYDEGKIVPLRKITDNEDQLSYQRLGQIIKKTIENIYDIDIKIKAERIKNNPTLQEEFKKMDIDNLGLDIKTTSAIKSKGYTEIRNLLELTEQDLKRGFFQKNIDYKQIIKRLNLFGYQLKKEENEIIKKDEMSKETYKFLLKRNIYDYKQLNEEYNDIISQNKIDSQIKIEIMELQRKHNSEKNMQMELLLQKKSLQKRLEQIEQRKLDLQEELETTLHINAEFQDKSLLIRKIYEKQKLLEELEKTLIKEIQSIDEKIQKKLENYIPTTLKKKI